jgi:hypothetical protein
MILSAEQWRALELLAGSPRGCTKARLLADGFTVDMLTAHAVRCDDECRTRTSVPGKAIAVGRIRITDAGRRWLEDAAKSELRGPNWLKDFWRE